MHKPFYLTVDPLPNASYGLTVYQRSAVRDGKPVAVGDIDDGLALESVRDLILETLRANHYAPAVLSPTRKKPLDLDEASGIRLSVLFRAIVPVYELDYLRVLQQGIWAMSDEEVYYWFSKCHSLNGKEALRVLFGVRV